jgi:enoyl-CoA hydratase/carnithine racemase
MRLVNPRVTVESWGDIAVIVADNPPVNALSHAVRSGLLEAINIAVGDASVRGLVFACRGRTFFAGADIAEFGKRTPGPNLSELVRVVENCAKPTAAALFGAALGGGFELALACHFRVSSASAQVGLPEVRLGILPGAGGTQRLPRLIGPQLAVSLIVSGNPISANLAHAWGAIDVIAEDPVAGAVEFLGKVLAEGKPVKRVRDREQHLQSARASPDEFDEAVLLETRKLAGMHAPVACAQSVRNSFLLPFDEALAIERRLFETLVVGEQSAALRYLFFAERSAAKSPDIREVRLPPVEPHAAAMKLKDLTFTHDGVTPTTTSDRVGLYSPVPLVTARLLEVVRDKGTDPASMGVVVSVAKQLRKVGVLVADSPGLVGPRMLARMVTESERLLAEGLSRQDVDAIFLKFGFSVAPLVLADAVGIAVIRDLQRTLGMVPQPAPNRAISTTDSVRRLLYPVINEAARILQENIVQRASDIDVVCVHGYGWPTWRGGPCFYAGSVGIPEICAMLGTEAAATGDITLVPVPLLISCASSGSKLTTAAGQLTQSATAATQQCATGG